MNVSDVDQIKPNTTRRTEHVIGIVFLEWTQCEYGIADSA
jgi:hypothetical protein